jgi:hypothetical protein
MSNILVIGGVNEGGVDEKTGVDTRVFIEKRRVVTTKEDLPFLFRRDSHLASLPVIRLGDTHARPDPWPRNPPPAQTHRRDGGGSGFRNRPVPVSAKRTGGAPSE